METRNQLLSGDHQNQDLHYQPAFDNNLHGPPAARDDYVPRSLGVTTNGVVPQNNIGSFATRRERINFDRCHSHEQYTGGGYHNVVASSHGPDLSPYHHSHAAPVPRNAFERRPDFSYYYEPIENENIGQQPADHQQPYRAGYTSPDSIEGSDIPSEHLTEARPDGEFSQELSSFDEQAFDDEDEVDDNEDEDDEEDGTDDDEHDDCRCLSAHAAEGATDKPVANDVKDSTQDSNPAPKRKRMYFLLAT